MQEQQQRTFIAPVLVRLGRVGLALVGPALIGLAVARTRTASTDP